MSLKIIGALACHINNNEDLERFKECIDSIKIQSNLTQCLISWSCNPTIENTCRQFLNSITNCEPIPFVALEQSEKLEQFQHYHKIMIYLRDTEIDHNFWLIFGDSDDIWEDKRVTFYKDTLLTLKENQIAAVINVKKVFDIEDSKYYIDTSRNLNSFEYWMTSVKFSVFQNFFDLASNGELTSPWCDLAFDRYILLLPTLDVFYFDNYKLKHNEWLYYHRKNGALSRSHSRGCSLTHSERISKFLEAQYLEYSFPDPLSKIYSWENLSYEKMFSLNEGVELTFPIIRQMRNGQISEYVTLNA